MTVNYSGTQLLAMLVALVDADAPFDAAKLLLVKNADPLTPTTQFADLEPADYDGAAASAAVVYQTPHLDDDGDAVVQVLPKEFKPTGDTTACDVTAIVLENSAGNAILGYINLDDSIHFANDMDVHLIGFEVRIQQPTRDTEAIIG